MTLGKTSKAVIKWGIYAVLLLLLYCIQTAPSLLTIHHVKPVLLIPLAVCIALYEGEVGSAVFGLVTGFLWDFASGKVGSASIHVFGASKRDKCPARRGSCKPYLQHLELFILLSHLGI